MKNWISLIYSTNSLLIISARFTAFSQNSDYKDRLGSVRDLVNSNELIMIWNQGENQSSQFCYQRIYDLDLTHPGGTDSTLRKKPIYIDSAITGNKNMAVATGNFLGGSFKHFVAAWEGPNNTITDFSPRNSNPVLLSWTSSKHHFFPGLAISWKKKIHR